MYLFNNITSTFCYCRVFCYFGEENNNCFMARMGLFESAKNAASAQNKIKKTRRENG